MSNFVDNDTTLAGPKVTLNPPPAGANLLNYWQASDYNALAQAADDLRTVITRQTSLMSYGADPTGATDSSAAFTAALSAMSNSGELLLPSVVAGTAAIYKITNSVTIPIGVTLVFGNNALISIASATTLTVNGAIKASDRQQIFEQAGTVVLSPGIVIIPQWFGAKGDGSTDDAVPLQQALDALQAGGTVRFPASTYITSAQLTVTGLWGGRILGDQQDGTVLQTKATFTNGAPLLQFDTCRNFLVQHMGFFGQTTSGHVPLCGIQFYETGANSIVGYQNRVFNCRFGQGTIQPFSDSGILFSALSGHDGDNDQNEIASCWFLGCGIHIGNSQSLLNRVRDCVIDGASIGTNTVGITCEGGSFDCRSTIFLTCITLFHFKEVVGDFGNNYTHKSTANEVMAENNNVFCIIDSTAGSSSGPCHFSASNCDMAPNGGSGGTSMAIEYIIDVNGPYAEFSMFNSDCWEGQTYTGIRATDAHNILRLVGNRIGVTNVTWSTYRNVVMGNTWVASNITVAAATTQALMQIADNGGVFTAGSDNPYSPAVNLQIGLVDETVSYSDASSPYTCAITDSTILASCNSGSPAIVLPSATLCPNKEILIKQTESSVTTISITAATGYIEGGASYTWTEPFTSARFKAVGSNWYVVGSGCGPNSLTPVNGGDVAIYGTNAVPIIIGGTLVAEFVSGGLTLSGGNLTQTASATPAKIVGNAAGTGGVAVVLENNVQQTSGIVAQVVNNGSAVFAIDYAGVPHTNGTPGISQVVALAKLTGGGANGTATFTNGLLTAYSAPT